VGDHWRPLSLPDLGPFASLEAVAIGADGRPWAVGFTVDAVSSRPVVLTFARGAPGGWDVAPAPPVGNFPTAVSVSPDRSVWVVDGNAIEHGTHG
jgi:hypothetical protein